MLFARVHGRIYWSCPKCNAQNRRNLDQLNYKIQCVSCKRWFVFGIVLYPVKASKHIDPPRDSLMIMDCFPSHGRLNRTYCEKCTDQVTDEVLQESLHHTFTPNAKARTRVNSARRHIPDEPKNT